MSRLGNHSLNESEDSIDKLWSMLRRTRNWKPEERQPVEQRLDAARVKAGLPPIQRRPRPTAEPQPH
jgi:hypothetical protein